MICHFISFSQTGVPGSFSKRSLESLHPFPSPPLTPASVACSFLEFLCRSLLRGLPASAAPAPAQSARCIATGGAAARIHRRAPPAAENLPPAFLCSSRRGQTSLHGLRSCVRHLRHLTRSPPATFPSAACPPPAARAGQAPCRLRAFVPAAPSLRLMRSAAPRVAARRRVPRRLPSTPRQRARLSVYFLPRACHLSASSPSVCVFVFLVLHRLFLPPECRLLEEGTRQACSKLDHQHLEQGLTLENAQYISDDGREGGREGGNPQWQMR